MTRKPAAAGVRSAVALAGVLLIAGALAPAARADGGDDPFPVDDAPVQQAMRETVGERCLPVFSCVYPYEAARDAAWEATYPHRHPEADLPVLDPYDVPFPFTDSAMLGDHADDASTGSPCREPEDEPGETVSAWYRFTTPAAGPMTIALDHPDLQMSLFAAGAGFEGDADELGLLRCEKVSERSSLVVPAVAGQTYYLLLTGVDWQTPYTLSASTGGMPAAYDHRADARPIAGKSVSWYSMSRASLELGEGTCGAAKQQTVWLQYTAGTTGGFVAKFEPHGLAITTHVAVYEPGSATPVSCGTTEAPFNGLADGVYDIQLSTDERWDGSLKVTVMPRDTPQVPAVSPDMPGILDGPLLPCTGSCP